MSNRKNGIINMKTITRIEDYMNKIKSPCIIIFGSPELCPPCLSLQKYITSIYSHEENIYEINMESNEFETIILNNDIYIMPTITYYISSREQLQHRIEGFNKDKVDKLIKLYNEDKKKYTTK